MNRPMTMQEFIDEMKQEEEYLSHVDIKIDKHKVNQEAEKLAKWFDEMILEQYINETKSD
jgi:hypothetical protein